VLNSVATRHNMDALAGYDLDRKTIHFEDVAGKGWTRTLDRHVMTKLKLLPTL